MENTATSQSSIQSIMSAVLADISQLTSSANESSNSDNSNSSNVEKFIIIKRLDGTSFRIEADGLNNIMDLKKRIEEQQNNLVSTQQLYSDGEICTNYGTVMQDLFNASSDNFITLNLIIVDRVLIVFMCIEVHYVTETCEGYHNGEQICLPKRTFTCNESELENKSAEQIILYKNHLMNNFSHDRFAYDLLAYDNRDTLERYIDAAVNHDDLPVFNSHYGYEVERSSTLHIDEEPLEEMENGYSIPNYC